MTIVRDGVLGIQSMGASVNIYEAGIADANLLQTWDAESGVYMVVREGELPVYTGETVVTPSEERVTLYTANKTVYQNIVVDPIPPNYGKVTQVGAVLLIT